MHKMLKKFGINHDAKALLEWDIELESCARLIYPEKFKKSENEN